MINTVQNIDCLIGMKRIADNSIYSCVTDPPYGLSTSNSKNTLNNLFFRMYNIMLPNFHEGNRQLVKYSDFVSILLKGSDLRMFESIPCIEPWIGVPESSIDFNSNIKISKEEVKTAAISSSARVSDSILMGKGDVVGDKNIGNYIFDFGDSVDFTESDVVSSNFGKLDNGFFSMPISSVFAPFSPHGGTDFFFPFNRHRVEYNILIDNNSGSNPCNSGTILTSGGAEGNLVLIFDLTNGAGSFFATITTVESNAVSQFVCPKVIRTFAATSDLSAKFESCRVSLVINSTDGANSIYHFHIWVPKKLLVNISKINDNGSGFMGKKWDYQIPSVEVWKEILRVLKPGGYILCACGTRTQHRMAVNIEDAGFEIRDVITWHYGSGFPKSLDIGKAVDKLQGNEREYVTTIKKIPSATGNLVAYGYRESYEGKTTMDITKGNSEYEGWGTALKPATEFWTLARKPLSENTVAENVLKWGTGGINIDGCRVEASDQNLLDAAVKRMSGNNANNGVFQSSKFIEPNTA